MRRRRNFRPARQPKTEEKRGFDSCDSAQVSDSRAVLGIDLLPRHLRGPKPTARMTHDGSNARSVAETHAGAPLEVRVTGQVSGQCRGSSGRSARWHGVIRDAAPLRGPAGGLTYPRRLA